MKKLNCNQVQALIGFYIKNILNSKLTEYINIHLENCPVCRHKIEEMRTLLIKYNNSAIDNTKNTQVVVNSDLKTYLSAYVDNELEYNDNIKIKKLTVSNSDIRMELEKLYKYRKIMQSVFAHTKKAIKKDFSKNIIAKVSSEEYCMNDYFRNIVFLFIVIILAIISGFVYLYL